MHHVRTEGRAKGEGAMNEKTTKVLRYSDKSGEEIHFPVAEIKGRADGPHFVITAGVHGCEYPGIASAVKLFKEIDPADLRGRITIVTVASVKAFEARNMFVCPVDGKNPNRFFPGDKDGTYTDAADYYLLKEIIAKGDYYMDLHGGDMVEALDPFSIYHVGAGDKIDRQSREIADYYALPNVVSTHTDGEWPDNGTTYANAAKSGIPAAIVEAGGIGQLDEASVEMHMRGLINVLRHFGSLKGEAFKSERQRHYSRFIWVYSEHKGIFYRNVNVGDEIQRGQTLGVVEDYFGQPLKEVISDAEGRILFLTTSPAVAQNGLLMGIGIK